MKFFLTILGWFFVIGSSVFAGELLITDTTGSPIPLCSVEFKCLSCGIGTRGKAAISNKNGAVAVPFSGRVLFRVTNVGYSSMVDTLENGESKKIVLRIKSVMSPVVVVTAQYSPQEQQKSLYKVRVIDNKRVEDQAAVTVRDVLSQELGVRLSQDNVLGTGMSLMGISGENVKILINGVPVIGRQDGNIDLQQLSLNNIERIEIVEGPLSVMYGTNALAGAINLITKKPVSGELTANVSAYSELVGAIGQHNLNGQFGFSIGETLLSVGGGRNFFGGYSNPDTSRAKQWKPREQYKADLSASSVVEGIQLQFRSSYFTELITSRGSPLSPYKESSFDDYFRTSRVVNSLSLSTRLSDVSQVELTAAYSSYFRRKNTFYRNLVTLEQSATSQDGDQDTSTYDAILLRGIYTNTTTDAPLNFQAGFDVNIESGSSARIVERSRRISDFAVFGSLQYSPLEEIIIQPALRVQANNDFARELPILGLKAELIPSLNLRLALLNNLSFRASYARGFRAPPLKELYLTFVDINHNVLGNSQLRPEYAHNWLAGLEFTVNNKSTALRFEASGFYNELRDMISLVGLGGTSFSYLNLDTYSTIGTLEKVQYLSEDFSIESGFSYIGRYNPASKSAEVQRYLFSQEWNSNMSYTIPRIDVRAAAFCKVTSRLPRMSVGADGTVSQGFVQGFTMLDISVSKELFGKMLLVSAGVKNVLDIDNVQTFSGEQTVHATSSSTQPVAWGRSFYLQMQWSLK